VEMIHDPGGWRWHLIPAIRLKERFCLSRAAKFRLTPIAFRVSWNQTPARGSVDHRMYVQFTLVDPVDDDLMQLSSLGFFP
jgi:hypothetical protein